MRSSLTVLALSAAVAACGGGGSAEAPGLTATTAAAPKRTPPESLTVIGNSITYSPAAADIGWSKSNGMAASLPSLDFAHLVAAGVNVANPSISNFSELERNPAEYAPKVAERVGRLDAKTAVVIELGDNAGQAPTTDFAAAYSALLDAVKTGASLACVSTFWEKPAMDAMIRAACEAHGGTYVYIGDVRGDPANKDRFDAPYPNIFVDGHPHDWAMGKIAERVLATLQ